MIDYGQTIKDLALTNIFPGDLMLKNFGLTRQNRIVCYDYDEVCLLTDCTVRRLPQTDDYDETIADEPWFAVAITISFLKNSTTSWRLRRPYEMHF